MRAAATKAQAMTELEVLHSGVMFAALPRAHLRASLRLAGCLAPAHRDEESVRVLRPVLKTCAALGLGQLIVGNGPSMLRLAPRAAEDVAADTTTAACVRDFVSGLGPTTAT